MQSVVHNSCTDEYRLRTLITANAHSIQTAGLRQLNNIAQLCPFCISSTTCCNFDCHLRHYSITIF